MKSGRYWVIGIFAVAGALALGAVLYWRRPETRVRWSFTQIHSSLLRNRKEVAASFLARRVTLARKDLSPAEFLESYDAKRVSGPLDVAPCPSIADHRLVRIAKGTYCFLLEGDLWRLHWVDAGPCACR